MILYLADKKLHSTIYINEMSVLPIQVHGPQEVAIVENKTESVQLIPIDVVVSIGDQMDLWIEIY